MQDDTMTLDGIKPESCLKSDANRIRVMDSRDRLPRASRNSVYQGAFLEQ